MVSDCSGVPSGIVEFHDGSAYLGSSPVDEFGVATFTTSQLSPGNHEVVATYVGDDAFSESVSSPLSQVVGQAATTTTVAVLPSPSSYLQTVTLTATVTPEFGGGPRGTSISTTETPGSEPGRS